MKLTVLLASAVVASLSGCVYIPGPPMTATNDARNYNLPAGSAGVHLGESASQVHDKLGAGDAFSTDGHQESWHLYHQLGWILALPLIPPHMFPGGFGPCILGESTLAVRYDQSWHVAKVRHESQTLPEWARSGAR